MKRREFLRQASVFVGAAGGMSIFDPFNGGALSAFASGALRAETWVSPTTYSPLQCNVLIAKEKGYFREQGLDITIMPTPGTATAVSQVAAGGALFTQGSAVATIPAIANQGAEIVTIGQVIYRSPIELASAPDKPMNRPADWQGKTIGIMSVGGATDILLDAMNVAAGFDPKNVKKVVTGPSVSAHAFLERGQVDAFFTFYPTQVAMAARGLKLHYLNPDDLVPIPSDTVVTSRRALIDPAARAAAIGYLRGCAKGMQFLLDPANVEESIDTLGKYNPLEAADRVAAREKFAVVRRLATRPAGVPFMYCDDQAWNKAVSLLSKIGTIKSDAPPASAYYTNELVKQM